jgi:hypothetical protein
LYDGKVKEKWGMLQKDFFATCERGFSLAHLFLPLVFADVFCFLSPCRYSFGAAEGRDKYNDWSERSERQPFQYNVVCCPISGFFPFLFFLLLAVLWLSGRAKRGRE